MFVVHGTKKFRERVKAPAPQIGDRSTTAMGDWYATVLLWKPQVALLVNESTLLPVLIPFTPSSTVLDRFPVALKAALASHEVGREFIAGEIDAMAEHRLTSTSNRSVLGMLNEFSFLADQWRRPEPRRRSPGAVAAPRSDPLRAAVQAACQPRPRTGHAHRSTRTWNVSPAAQAAHVLRRLREASRCCSAVVLAGVNDTSPSWRFGRQRRFSGLDHSTRSPVPRSWFSITPCPADATTGCRRWRSGTRHQRAGGCDTACTWLPSAASTATATSSCRRWTSARPRMRIHQSRDQSSS